MWFCNRPNEQPRKNAALLQYPIYKDELQQVNRFGTVCQKTIDGLRMDGALLSLLTLTSSLVLMPLEITNAGHLPHMWNYTVTTQ